MSFLYLIVNILAVLFPVIFSFHPRLRFNKKWRSAWPAILCTALPFILWDIYFTGKGIWGFNDKYLTGFFIANLPVEEILFFICIPYACLFTHHCFNILVNKDFLKPFKKNISLLLVLLLPILAAYYWTKAYTFTTFLLTAVFILLHSFVFKSSWLSHFYFSYLFLLIPFFIVNGILTGTGPEQPVVWYNNFENMNIRLLTIPVEDFFYGMLLILLNVSVFEYLERKVVTYLP